MGIQNLFKLIKECAPGAIQTLLVSELRGWRVGIDASITIYQWCSVGRARKIVNGQGKYINHIQGAFFRTLTMLELGIVPVYIFDGAPPVVKGNVIAKRKELRDAGASTRVPREVFAEVQKLLDIMGVRTVQAVSEAEAQAAYYTTVDYLYGVATEDTDVLAFGARYMIRGLDTAAKSVTVISREELLAKLQLTQDQFIDLCILLGCDYTGTLPGVGYKRALALIKKHKSIEAILAEEKIVRPESFDYEAARAEFKNPAVSKNFLDPTPRKLGVGDIATLQDYLLNIHGLDAKRVTKSLSKLSEFHGVK